MIASLFKKRRSDKATAQVNAAKPHKVVAKYTPLYYHYFYVFAPLGVLMLGSLGFVDALIKAMTENPHPQVNYAIVWTCLIGTLTMMMVIRVLSMEERLVKQFVAAYNAQASKEDLMALAGKQLVNVTNLLQLIASTIGRPITRTEQAAIEHEMHGVESRLHASMDLPQYIAGLMVALGLLGTFIGLLVTLGDTSDLIAQLVNAAPAGGGASDDLFRNMIGSLKKPMVSMGIAFSASMFGLLGSIAMGFSLLATRHATRKLITIVNNEIHHIIEIGAYGAWDSKRGSAPTVANTHQLTSTSVTQPAVAPISGFAPHMGNKGGELSPETLATFDGLADHIRQMIAAVNLVAVKNEQSVLAAQRVAQALEVRNRLDEAALRESAATGTPMRDLALQQLNIAIRQSERLDELAALAKITQETAAKNQHYADAAQRMAQALEVRNRLDEKSATDMAGGPPMRDLLIQQLHTELRQSEKLDELTALVRAAMEYRSNGLEDRVSGIGVLLQQTHDASSKTQRELINNVRQSLESQRNALLTLIEKIQPSTTLSPIKSH